MLFASRRFQSLEVTRRNIWVATSGSPRRFLAARGAEPIDSSSSRSRWCVSWTASSPRRYPPGLCCDSSGGPAPSACYRALKPRRQDGAHLLTDRGGSPKASSNSQSKK
eukprot:GHVT01062424.1.p2 GENE.GHVT01062424.1~~GHVT01062424.1.p2  ORF type:complete len:109 (-),score=31.36 GHVT01062424.1:595-921(-)